MEQLPRLAARIGSLGELRDLFRALRALAASRVQEAQAALAAVHRYVEVIEDAIAEGAGLLPEAERHALDEYLLAELTRALVDGLCSENAARLRVMDAADRSCERKLEVLRRRARRVRQEAITEELLDLATGAEAILSAP